MCVCVHIGGEGQLVLWIRPLKISHTASSQHQGSSKPLPAGTHRHGNDTAGGDTMRWSCLIILFSDRFLKSETLQGCGRWLGLHVFIGILFSSIFFFNEKQKLHFILRNQSFLSVKTFTGVFCLSEFHFTSVKFLLALMFEINVCCLEQCLCHYWQQHSWTVQQFLLHTHIYSTATVFQHKHDR